MYNCWHCGKDIQSELANKKVSFRAICRHCFAALHACLGCTHYKRGAPNDCDVPDIEPVRDKDKSNFCEEFNPLFQLRDKKSSKTDDIEKKLFGDVELPKKKDLKDLFGE